MAVLTTHDSGERRSVRRLLQNASGALNRTGSTTKNRLLRDVRLDLVVALSSTGRARRHHEERRFFFRCDFTTCLMKLAASNAMEHGRRLQNPTGHTGKTATWDHVHNTQTSDLRSCGRTDACIWGRMSWTASLPNTCLPGGSQSCPRLEL